MKGSEFLRRLRRLGRKNGIRVRRDEKRGKGSHAALYYGRHRTIIKDLTKEISPGLLDRHCRDLGIKKGDL